MKTNLSIETIRSKVLKVARTYKDIKSVKLVGSYAKGNASYNSDVDFIISLEDDFSLETFFDFQDDIELELGVPVDLLEETGVLDSCIADSILSGGVEIYVRS